MTMSQREIVDAVVRLLHQQRYGHLARRVCTAESPMEVADKDKYRWSHPDAVEIARLPVANDVRLYECPHCRLRFDAFPPENPS